MKNIAGILPGVLTCGSNARARSRSRHRQLSNTPPLHPSAFLLLLLSVVNLPPSACRAEGSAFTYQGRLADDGGPANGLYDLRFAVYDSTNSPGTLIAGPITNSASAVSNGLFTAQLDFGANVFDGSPRWLEIGVRTNGGGTFQMLTPRQPLTPTPYAIHSGSAALASTADGVAPGSVTGAGIAPGSITAGNIAAGQVLKSLNGYSDAVTLSPGPNIGISAAGNNLQISALRLWTLDGNAGTAPANGDFLGTTDFQPLEFKAGGLRVLRLEPDPRANGIAGNLIGGSTNNVVEQPGSGGNVIGGGGYDAGPNVIHSNTAGAFIGAGSANQIGPNLNNGYIGAGYANTIQSAESAVVGGDFNTIQFNATYGVIGGGFHNVIQSNALYGGILGGYGNTNSGPDATIGGGYQNVGSGGSTTIAGGVFNVSSNDFAAIGGGNHNVSGGYASAVPGGQNNLSTGDFSAVGGGAANAGSGYSATIGGGQANVGSGSYATIAGGYSNAGTNEYSTIGGGEHNTAGGSHATIGGGYSNTGSGRSAVVGGGQFDTSSGDYATVPGGAGNRAAGAYSLAAGVGSRADHDGTFIWSDASDLFNGFTSTGSNQFLVRATGGVGINTNDPGGATLSVAGKVKATSFEGDGSGLVNVSSGALGNYVFAYTTTAQNVATPSAYQDIPFSTDAQLNGWTHTGGTASYTCAQSGLYLIQYNAQATTTLATGTNVSVRATLNGVEIPGSQASVILSSTSIEMLSLTRSFVASVNAAAVLTLQFTGSSTASHLVGGGIASTRPSVSLTITRIQ